MNKYRDKSDFEINKAVAAFNGMVRYNVVESDEKIYTSFDEFDPCNNPADAMPIIIENKIDLTHLVGDMVCAKHKEYWCIRKNPYRAGCEVYLLMKDAENEKS
ncbi:phage protein NinX family protein [Morganella morganii]|uniref:phage protein NinX family protein n=1 Tax=Morganella morganii TaxID=582 RepID=UPI00298D7523|nr:phage protein NinX family protein [Morganella morganii]MDW7782264.1 phage protein NinX family protein [Morganella morganii]MDW7792318.1 phage protein NinX family protein [Morganella morganii]